MTLANKLTIGRILLIPLFIVSVLYYSPESDFLRFVSLGIFTLAMFTDWLDGFIARKYNQTTKFGSILDPLADKFLMISAFLCIYKVSVSFPYFQFPLWLVITVISRDVLLMVGGIVINILVGEVKVQPSIWGKCSTLFQTLSVITILLQLNISIYIWTITLIFIIISFITYCIEGINQISKTVKV